ncbi:MAG TPA: Ig-like domain-containing protein [Candidatus Aquicultor sp.]
MRKHFITLAILVIAAMVLCAPAAFAAAPTVTITTPASGATVAGTIPINATCAASGATISSASYQIDGGVAVSMSGPTGAASGTWTSWWDTSKVTNASHTIKVTTTDSLGVTGSAQITVTANNPTPAPPTVKITAPTAGATVVGSNVAITADCTGGSGYTVTDVSYKIGTGTPQVMAGPDGSIAGTWNSLWDTTKEKNATYTLAVTVTNSAGKTATASISVKVNNSSSTLSIQTVSNKYRYNPSNVVVVRAIAQNGLNRLTSGRISTAKVTIKDPANKVIVNAVAMSKDSTTGFMFYSYTLPAAPAKGVWTVSVAVTDTRAWTGTGTNTFKVELPVPDHSQYITASNPYLGTKTCITSACHATQANTMFSSLHYQWRGDNSKAIELAGSNPQVSKMGGINNYCVWAEGNWIGTMTNLDNTANNKCGCAWCHAGLGLKPATVSSQAQLENIDCLICHSTSYKRIVQTNPDGTFVLVPDPTIDIQAAAKTISRPTKATCLRCHANAGGGDNNKRGDIDSKLPTCVKSYDVHMGTDGQNFECQDCHRTISHKMAGRGNDMRAVDLNFDMSCETCHTKVPHRSTNVNYKYLDRHTDRLNCTTCHVSAFAKAVSTDMVRDWRTLEPIPAINRWDPTITRGSNVMPTYAWFNSFSHFYKFLDPVTYAANGKVQMAYPDGAYTDIPGKPMAKLYPFKVHETWQPKNNAVGNKFDNILLPIRNKVAFETGDVNAAIIEGTNIANVTYNGHTFVQTQSYQSIHHAVGPKSTALSCATATVCHAQLGGTVARIPFSSLGYVRRGTDAQLCDVCHSMHSRSSMSFTSFHAEHRDRNNCATCHGVGYPLKEPRTTLCDNCHSYKSVSDPNWIHNKHVQGKGYDCSNCHTFTRSLTSGGHLKSHDD